MASEAEREAAREAKRAAQMRSSAARIGANCSWAVTADWSSRTAPARAAFLSRFEAQVDPDGTLDPQIRAKRADAAMRAYMGQLAKRRAQKKKKASPAT